LFLDEPTTGLDPMSRKIVWDYIEYLRREKKMTIFLTTHYMEEVRDADHVVILDKGRIIADDTPGGLKSKYTGSRLYWYASDCKENRDVLEGLEYAYESDRFTIKLPKEPDFSLTDLLNRNRERITDYEVIKGSMDDVFLNLTGRKMGE